MFRLVVFSCLFLATFADSDNEPKPSEERIVGGRDTDITVVPHQVSVQYNGKHICGGSIIGPRHILTAAHCVDLRDEELFTVRAGSSYHFKEGHLVNVIKITTHPNYDASNIDYDAAILELIEPLTSDKEVQIATLANVEPQEEEMVLISGWGSIAEGKNASDFLQSVSVPVVSKIDCKETYEDVNEITDQMFCAAHPTGEMDSCEGDSGGPAMVKGKLAGIVSWGEMCGDENFPSVYTTVAKILPWIATQI